MKKILAALLTVALAVSLMVVPAAGSGDELLQKYEATDKVFERYEIGDKIVYFHQRMIDEAIVEGDFIVYQFDKNTEELLDKKTHWRGGLPEHLPPAATTIAKETAESMIRGETQFSKLYIMSPESDVFPLKSTPENPCWVVTSLDDGNLNVTIIDAVEGEILGYGIPPPYTGFSLGGPNWDSCYPYYTTWAKSAEAGFETMGYDTEMVDCPTDAKVRSHIQSTETAMFYELAHGSSHSFHNTCPNSESITAAEIETWIEGYTKMSFTFIGSCGGMCDVGPGTLSYEFRKGSPDDTVTVGYCGMGTEACSDCWRYSVRWQDALFNYMSQGQTVKQAFDNAMADFPVCLDCMRFAGDEDFAVVPTVTRTAPDYYGSFLRMPEWLATQQLADGGIQEAEDYPETFTDNTAEAIWTWSCYAGLTGDYATYLPNINNAWDFCYANPSWEEGSSPTNYYTVYNLGWGLLAEMKYREVYGGRPGYIDHTWYGEQCANTLINYAPGTGDTRSALCLGLAAGSLCQYGVDVNNSAYCLRAAELGNSVRQWLEADVSRFASESWAVSGGIAVWGVLNSHFQENPGGADWAQEFASNMPFNAHDDKNDDYEYGHDGWYAWAYYEVSKALNSDSYFGKYRSIMDYLLNVDGDEDGGIPQGPTYTDNQDFAWVTNVAAFALNLGLLGFSPDIVVHPATFGLVLSPDTMWTGALTIGNDGDAPLTYDLSDRPAAAPGLSSAPLVVSPSSPSVPPDKIGADELPLFEGPPLPASPEEEYVPDQVIVKFKDAIRNSDVQQLNQLLGTEVVYTSPFAGFKVLQIPEGKTVAEMVDVYSEQAIVEYAEPNYIDHIAWSPNDPYYSYQWHFDQVNLESAWDLDTTAPLYGGDPSIVVAVIDTGVAYETYSGYMQAPDLASTTFVDGYDFVNNDAHPNDDHHHGTHVCGTIAQSTNNMEGVAGIAFNTAIMPVKAFDSDGSGADAWIADAFYYAADNGAHIISYSAGGSHSTTKENAVAYAYNHGVTIICAAGNDYETGNDPEYPAAYDDYCIAVGAVRYDQMHSYYSNTGSYVDIAAPGGDTNVDQNGDGYEDGVLQQTFDIYFRDPTDFAYWFLQGTSMACPHVAGVAALILAKNPSFTPGQVRQALESTATDLGDAGRDDVYGWGLLNAPAAVAWASDCPWLDEDPKSGTVVPGDSDDITVTIDTTALTEGDYSAEIIITSNDPDESTTIVPVSVHVAPIDNIVQVTTDPGGDVYPAIVQTADGKVWVVWSSYRSGNGDIWYKTSSDGGATWSTASQITTDPDWDEYPAITQTDDGKVWVAWTSYRSGNANIWYKTSSDGGMSWSTASQITSDISWDYCSAITETTDGKVWVVWESYRSGSYAIWYKTSADGGATWSDASQITTDPDDEYYPAIVQTADGKVWVVWSSYRSGNGDIWYKTSSNGGATWSIASQITTDPGWDELPTIAQTDDGKVWVGWYCYRSGSHDIWYKTSSDGGASWSDASRFTIFAGHDVLPTATALSSGNLALAWCSNRAVNYDVWYGVIDSMEDINPPPHLDWAENEPASPDTEQPVTVRAEASDESGVEDVQLVWWMDGSPQGNRTMYDDGNHDDWSAGDDVYGVQLGPFPGVGTVVEYQIQLTDIDNNTVLTPQYPYSFEVIGPFVKTADILMVGDEASWIIPYYTDTLDTLGYACDVWNSEARENIDGETLNQYVDGIVIWATPSWGYIGYSETQDNLTSYLDNGGKLFISGQDIGYYVSSSDFYQDYLHAQYVQDDIDLYGLFGAPGDPISDGLYVSISGGDGANNQAWPSEVDPISPAVRIFTYDPAATTALVEPSVPEEEVPPESDEMLPQGEEVPWHTTSVERGAGTKAIESSGSGGLRVDTGTYEVVYFAFGFEAINSAADRATVMDQVLNWLAPIVTYNLTINGTDGGNVTTPGEGTFTCNASEVVDLVATADANYTFVNWSGDTGTIANCNAASTNITMSGNYSIMANFAEGAPAPVWSVGDNWVYSCSYENPGGNTEQDTCELEVTVVGEEAVGAEACYKLSGVFEPPATRDAADMPLTLHIETADIWNSKDHMEYLKTSSAIAELPGLPSTVTWTYPGDYGWPYGVGKTWSASVRVVAGPLDEITELEFKVLGVETITVPAGTFECYHIVTYEPASPDTYTNEHWFNATVVKSVVKEIDRFLWAGEETRELVSYSAQYNLTINSTSGGNVTTPGEGVQGPYNYSEVVGLVATADSGYQFVNWTGDVGRIADVDSRTTNITMNGNYSIMANFEEGPVPYNVTVKIEPATTHVSRGGSFTIDAVIDNPNAMPVAMHNVRLNFDPDYFTVDSASLVDFDTEMTPVTIDNVAGQVDYDPHMPAGTNTTDTWIVSARINCTAKSLVGNSTISWVYTSGPPPRYTKVIKGTTDYLEGGNMSLMFNGTVMVVPGATLEGHVDLQGLPATNVTVRFFDAGTQNENVTMKTHTSTDSNGDFTIGNITPGTYDVGVKGSTSLSNLESGVNLTGGGTTYREFGVLLEGDASGDDYVDAGDFGPLSGAWLSWPGQPSWDARADFSRDSYIDASDFGLLSANWLKWGDCFGWPGNWT